MLRIEQNREAFGVLIELKAIEGAPRCRDGVSVDFNTFDDPTKAHGLAYRTARLRGTTRKSWDPYFNSCAET